VGFSFFALTAVRNGIWFSMVISPILARSVRGLDFSEAARSSDWLQRWFRKRAGRGRPSPVLNLIVALAMSTGIVISLPWISPFVYGKPLWEPETPVGVMDFIEEEEITGTIFHPQAYGDYLIWRLWPRQRSFVDGRVHIFGGELVEDYIRVFHDTCWETRLARYDIEYLLLRSEGLEDKASNHLLEAARNSPDWKVLYEDDLSVLLERISP
jgi:hypothetical protein